MENFNKDVLEEFKNVLNSDKIDDPDSISLYDVKTLVNSKYDIVKKIEKTYEKKINNILKSKIKNCRSRLHSFYTTDVIGLDFASSEFDFPYMMWFHKVNGDLCIKCSEYTLYDDKILLYAGNVLSELYDAINEFKDFFDQKSSDVKSFNSNLSIEITNNHAKVFKKQDVVVYNDTKEKEFEMTWDNSNRKYIYKCKSNNLINTIGNNEDEIFKRVFVKIEDCPKWMQKQLYEIRKYQLMNDNAKSLAENVDNNTKDNYELLMDKINQFLNKDIVNCENSLIEVINLYDLYNIINNELEDWRNIHIKSKIQKKLESINMFSTIFNQKSIFVYLGTELNRCSITFYDDDIEKNVFANRLLTVCKDDRIDEIYFNEEQNKENKLIHKFINKNYDLVLESLNTLERYKKLIGGKSNKICEQVFENDLFEIIFYYDKQGVVNTKININSSHKLSSENSKKWYRRENITDFLDKNKNEILKRISVNPYELNKHFIGLYNNYKYKQYNNKKTKKLRLTK